MHMRGRLEDSDFSDLEELLYHRYLLDQWVEGQFVGVGFRFPGQSVNRQKYSEPKDVLFSETDEYARFGVLEYPVTAVTKSLPNQELEIFNFYPKHRPLELNYAHSEIWCDCPQRQQVNIVPSPGVRKIFRTELSRYARVRISAQT
jgi:hypothetical protein